MPRVRAGLPAAASRKPRQARKGAAVAVMPGAGVGLARAHCGTSIQLQGISGHMSYLALARKWRPRTFEDVVGQPHVVRALGSLLRP